MIFHRIPALLTFIVFIAGCSTTRHEPLSDQDALVVGTLVLEAKNFSGAGAANVNGRTGNGIKITVVNTDSGAVKRILTYGNTGLFMIPVEAPSNYRIQEVRYHIETNRGAWAYVYTRPHNFQFQSKAGAVTNLGQLSWTADGHKDTASLASDGGEEAVRELFENRYSESDWLLRPWFH